MRKTFVFNTEWAEVLMEYPAEVRLEVYDAIIRYAASGTLSELKPLARMAFSFIKGDIDRTNGKFNDTVRSRSEAGSRHSGNQYTRKADTAEGRSTPKMEQNGTNGTNGTSVPKLEQMEQNGTNGTNGTEYEYEYENKKEIANAIKKKPKTHYAPDVMLTEDEYAKLLEGYGEDGAKWMIQKLDDYKASRGMTYKSDYRAILSWVVREYQKQQQYDRNTNTAQYADYRTNSEAKAAEQRRAEVAKLIYEELNGNAEV